MCTSELAIGNMQNFAFFLRGAKALIEARGGPWTSTHSLEYFILKLCATYDVMAAVATGTAPSFKGDWWSRDQDQTAEERQTGFTLSAIRLCPFFQEWRGWQSRTKTTRSFCG